ncbi:MAG: FAD-dependent monooxygenase [Alphaproteobacteria bacterium]|nr:FAD-dependent monooxygenase [Alphaproteobacteria bacterium]
MTSALPLDALILGAGPAGGALGYLLASRGLRVTVVEKAQDFNRQFRGEGLQPSGMSCLAQMGLSEAFEQVPKRQASRMRFFHGGRETELAVADTGTRMVHQPAMLDMFAAQSEAFEGFTLVRGAPFQELLWEGERVVGARVKVDGAPQELRARLVVACDGRGSRARRQAELPSTSLDQRFDILWLKADLGDFLPDTRTIWWEMAGDHAVLVYPSPTGVHQLGVILGKGEAREIPPAQRLDQVISWVSPRLREALEAARQGVEGPALLKVVCERLERWSRPGLLLLGDAAHPMSPVGGQGINMALRDAIVAANHLVPPLREGAAPEALDAAAAAVAEERLPDIIGIQDMQTRAGRKLAHPPTWALRLLPWLKRLGIDPTRFNRRRWRMRQGLTEVRLGV